MATLIKKSLKANRHLKTLAFDNNYHYLGSMPPENTNIQPADFSGLETAPQEKVPFKVRAEAFIDKYTPEFVKRGCNKILEMLPEKTSNWIRAHRFRVICTFYIIRGIFLRPSMWVLYIAAWGYIKNL